VQWIAACILCISSKFQTVSPALNSNIRKILIDLELKQAEAQPRLAHQDINKACVKTTPHLHEQDMRNIFIDSEERLHRN
jgi:hypothetical protein